ncbi:MAG: mechanosensitive ion channel family protein [Nitrososphaeraceae archaeon]|nr:mechanosensitive ion channel family protein [Nitrososphaeraceae archaeon]
MPSSPSSENQHETSASPRSTLQNKFINFAVKTFLLVAGTWVGLYIFSILEPYFGIKQLHVQVTGTIATLAISFILITGIRRLLQRMTPRIGIHLSASISFFMAIIVSLFAIITLMYQWNIDPESILVGGGVAAIIVGIGISNLVGNMLSAGLMLTTFPAKIGDNIYIVNDKIRGRVIEISFIYTKIITEEGTEYIVPNNAIVQGNVRITKGAPSDDLQLPFTQGENIEVTDSSKRYAGIVTKITANFTTITSSGTKNEIILSNNSIMSGQFVIIKKSYIKTRD